MKSMNIDAAAKVRCRQWTGNKELVNVGLFNS